VVKIPLPDGAAALPIGEFALLVRYLPEVRAAEAASATLSNRV
jgi:hypothetical protein